MLNLTRQSSEQFQRTDREMGPGLRISSVQTPIISVVGELIRDHPGTISLGQGIVWYPPPAHVVERVVEGMAAPEQHRYSHVAGIPALLSSIRQKLQRENGYPLFEGMEVVVTAGGNMAFLNAVLAITDPGDEIILQTPYYFNHEMAIGIADCKAVCVQTDENYQLQIEAIRTAITDRTRAVVTISPNNPTGAVYPEHDLKAVNALCKQYGLYHIHDEAYEYFTYEGVQHFSPGSIEDAAGHTIGLFSFSKAYGMAGWRIGYMVVPERLIPAVKKIQDTNLICPPVPGQIAALAALETGASYCRKHVRILGEIRQLVLEELKELGDVVTVPPAMGAFYLLLRVHTDLNDMELVRRLVREYGVAVIPGSTFGVTDGCYLRLAYGALEKDTVVEAVGRLVRGLSHLI